MLTILLTFLMKLLMSVVEVLNSITAVFIYSFSSQRGSFEITTAFIETYKSNIYMLAQQKMARLASKCRQESQQADTDFYERIGVVDAVEITDRHGDTPQMNVPHSRRAVSLIDAEFSDLIDKMDRVRLLINPDDAYVMAAVNAHNRFKDDVFIGAALGIARAGRKAEVSVGLPDSQKVGATDGVTSTGLNVFTLTLVQERFDLADVDDEMARYFAYSARQKQNLLNQEQVTSADFNTVRALVMGKINSYMGFEFIRSERLPVTLASQAFDAATGEVGTGLPQTIAAGARRCIAWCEDGMVFATGIDMITRISERDDKRYSTQVYAAQSVGAVRLEEVKVVEVLCAE